MKRAFLAAILILTALALTGCGDHGPPPPPPTTTVTTDIFSDPTFDGHIRQDPFTGAFTIFQGNTQSVLAGLDPVTGAEFRAFLDFPLTGAGGVPGNAVIVSAFLDIVVNSVTTQTPTSTIPIRIDLVDFQPPTLVGTDFDRTLQPALATTTISPPISQADFGKHITVDVTPLMEEAQRLGLLNFQVRILEDLGPVSPGLVEINDTTGVNSNVLAPLLQVTYF